MFHSLKALAVAVAVLGAAPAVNAHEGHDSVPGANKAPHGGVLKFSKEIAVELVSDSSGVQLYPLDHDLKPLPLKDLKAKATAQPPKKKAQPVKLTEAGDHYTATVDAAGAYRYTLEFTATYKGKDEKVSFQVEPQQ